MTTLATLRGYLNDELAVADDSETSPFSKTLRNRAISQGYAALWRSKVWKPVQVDVAVTDGSVFYTVSGMRRLGAAYRLGSDGLPLEKVPALLEERGASNYVLTIAAMDAGDTIRLEGWTAYASTFASDSSSDDLPDELNRLPLLKAKAICYRKVLSDFARYGTRQIAPPEMNVTVDQIVGIISAAEREFEAEARLVAKQRTRYGQPMRNRIL